MDLDRIIHEKLYWMGTLIRSAIGGCADGTLSKGVSLNRRIQLCSYMIYKE